MIETAKAVRAWLRTLPGMIEASTPAECLHKAWAAYGGPGSVEDFKAALKAEGFPVVEVGAVYRLTLPTKPVQSENKFHRLRNIRSRLDGQR